ncbi:hypothetical protein C9E81_17640 [Paracoccus alkanivorans]|uniref:dUTP diphosphatase n=1 Tax=Paracoccus alkanivorans TaxID=2116655 RepID=A0A3M0M954_9RHOB|nr:hypothetical protein C9E81_17640 [Paracoccus alkanivorans]
MSRWLHAGEWVKQARISIFSRFTRALVINSDYRGPLGVILINLGDAPYRVGHGDRIAQIVVAPAPQAIFTEVRDLTATVRGAGGFGSTGAS